MNEKLINNIWQSIGSKSLSIQKKNNHEYKCSYGLQSKLNNWKTGHGNGQCDGFEWTCIDMATNADETRYKVLLIKVPFDSDT